MLAGLLLLPVLELAVAIEVGRLVGPLPVLAALLAGAVAGAVLAHRQGAAAWRSLTGSVRAGEPPARELADATVLVAAGLLLILPGFVSDALALLLLFPPTRPLARRPLERALRRAAADRIVLSRPPGAAFGDPLGRPPRFGGDVVEGEIVDDGGPAR